MRQLTKAHSQKLGKSDDRIALSGLELQAPVEIRRHPAARRLTLRVSRTRRAVIVTVPVNCGREEAGRFLRRHLDWVRERLDDLPEPVAFAHDAVVPLRGVPHRLRFSGAVRAADLVRREVTDEDELPRLRVAGRHEHAPRRFRDWLAQQARQDLEERVNWHARNLSLRVRRIAVRDQTTRWGSCSSSGLLSFSWRLILAPPLVLDYVAAHEVAHLAEMNHGPRFWQLVEATMPRMDEAKAWLRCDGMDLHRYDI